MTIGPIQAAINRGYGVCAQVLGDSYSWYRPDMPFAPIAPESYLGQQTVLFSPDAQFMFWRPADYPQADRWYGAFENQAAVQTGDYFQGPDPMNPRSGNQITFTVTYVERIAAIQCLWCNRTISVGRALDPVPAGPSTAYSGQSMFNTTTILSGWPASVRQLGSGMKMRGADMQLPSDAPLGAYGILFPSLADYPIQWNDIITDDLGRRYAISTLELSPLGWRISAEMWPT